MNAPTLPWPFGLPEYPDPATFPTSRTSWRAPVEAKAATRKPDRGRHHTTAEVHAMRAAAVVRLFADSAEVTRAAILDAMADAGVPAGATNHSGATAALVRKGVIRKAARKGWYRAGVEPC